MIRALLYADLGKTREAIADIERLLEVEPSNAFAPKARTMIRGLRTKLNGTE